MDTTRWSTPAPFRVMGLVQITNRRPDGEAEWLDAYGAVARKP